MISITFRISNLIHCHILLNKSFLSLKISIKWPYELGLRSTIPISWMRLFLSIKWYTWYLKLIYDPFLRLRCADTTSIFSYIHLFYNIQGFRLSEALLLLLLIYLMSLSGTWRLNRGWWGRYLACLTKLLFFANIIINIFF